jgi:hypothetical protein
MIGLNEGQSRDKKLPLTCEYEFPSWEFELERVP